MSVAFRGGAESHAVSASILTSRDTVPWGTKLLALGEFDMAKKEPDSLMNAIYEDLDVLHELDAQDERAIKGGTTNYIVSGGHFSSSQKFDLSLDQSTMQSAISTISGLQSNHILNVGMSDCLVTNCPDTSANYADMNNVVQHVQTLINNEGTTFNADQAAPTASSSAQSTFVSTEHVNAELATAAASAVSEAAAPIIAGVNNSQIMCQFVLGPIQTENAATTYVNGGNSGETIYQADQNFQQNVINDTTANLVKDGVSASEIPSLLQEIGE